jgi:hypothetical protein
VASPWLIPQDREVARVTELWRVHGESLYLEGSIPEQPRLHLLDLGE